MDHPLLSIANVAAEPSCSNAFECSPQQVSLLSSPSQIQGYKDTHSQDDIFTLICQEIHEVAPQLKYLGELYSKHIKRLQSYQSHSLSNSCNEEYSDILSMKGYLYDKLTEAVKNSNSTGIPKYKRIADHEFSSMLTHHCNEVCQEVQQQNEQSNKSKNDCERLNRYTHQFSSLEEQSNHPEGENAAQLRLLFQESKKDMESIIKARCPDETMRTEVLSTLAVLFKAYMNNLENTEEQYVEVSTLSLMHTRIMQCWVQGGVIIPHPLYPHLFRFCVE